MKCKCTKCGLTDYSVSFLNNKCYECDGNVKFVGPFYVNTYIVNRAYGGPEEGGWWYDCGEPIDSRLCDTYEEMIEVKDKIKLKCLEDNEELRPLDSVLSNGIYEVFTEDHFAEVWPQFKPHYE